MLADLPVQIVWLLPTVAEGNALIVAEVVPAALVHPLTVTVAEYVPEAAVVADEMLGFCDDELKLFGPVQA